METNRILAARPQVRTYVRTYLGSGREDAIRLHRVLDGDGVGEPPIQQQRLLGRESLGGRGTHREGDPLSRERVMMNETSRAGEREERWTASVGESVSQSVCL
eukprot:GHVU01024307.1.p1 GENE.GHVU01024307.1~~GHVU01024307.1.p1  ORF type:complete len:103 (+),score=10.85 GHVU01024307.1:273-581(+)